MTQDADVSPSVLSLLAEIRTAVEARSSEIRKLVEDRAAEARGVMERRHEQLDEVVNKGFQYHRSVLDEHTRAITGVESRVMMIETQRAMEHATAIEQRDRDRVDQSRRQWQWGITVTIASFIAREIWAAIGPH